MIAAAPEASSSNARIGVLLVNLGTPDSPSYFAVQRYLREFLSDPRVIDTPRMIWLPILYGAVLPFRPLRSARNYRKIWMKEGSPLAVYSQRLTDKIKARLHASHAGRVIVELAMSYGNPNIARVIQSLAEQRIERLLVLPLYPQYCSSTTGAVIDGANAALRRARISPEMRLIENYHDDPGYIGQQSRKIADHWATAGARSHLLLSYHGIPASYVAKGDPYRRQTERTTELVVKKLGLSEAEFSHCYQSRFGRVEWLKPYTIDKMKELAERGVRQLTVASPSFAVDCLETLEEIAIEYRDRFLEMGGERLTLVAGLNDDEAHADVLTELINRRLGDWVQT